MADGLNSIEGLADKHQRVLARHHVTDLRGLVQADRRVIHRAMANLRPRPTLELVSRWQDDARSMLDETVTDTSDWHTAASFVVVFGQRQRNGAWERRVEVEQTEVEPERNPQLWPGWDCTPVCAWLTSQLDQPASPRRPQARPAPPPSPRARRGGEPATSRGRTARASLGTQPRTPARRRPAVAAHRQRHPDRRGRRQRCGEGRRARRGPAHRAHRAGPGGSHRQRGPAGNAPAGGCPHPAPGRPRLESLAPQWSRPPPARPSSTCPRSPPVTTRSP